MNLVDLLDENGLQQDAWSLTKPVFGKDGQLEVVGWSGKNSTAKYYILKCFVCAGDPDLHGEGNFRCLRNNLKKGRTPCACSKKPEWSVEQYTTLCSRKAKELDYNFLGFEGEWKAQYTKTRLLCNDHGEWTSGTITTLINKRGGCPECAHLINSAALVKPDEVMIKSFFNSDCFHVETKFWRSERKDSRGLQNYWHVYCPECDEYGESLSGNLQAGKRPCACSPHSQKESYVNFIKDSELVIAVKFGIARNSMRRVRQQNYKSQYQVVNYLIYNFPTVESCKSAERECKQELECGVIPKSMLPDGHTETTYAYNLDKIKQIYEKHGGVELCHSH